jgi:polysaccharide biosynthesis protein PslG
MLSCSPLRMFLPRFCLLAVGLMLVGACAAGAPKSASTPGTDAPGAAAGAAEREVGTTPDVAAVPAVATVPAASAALTTLPARRAASTHVASGGSSSAAVGSAFADGSGTIAGSGSAATVYGYAAPEIASWSSAEQVQQLKAMKATGATSVRVDASWDTGQPDGPGSYDWTSLDQEMASIREAGLSADLIIDGCPSWAAVSGAQGNTYAQPTSSSEFASWAAAVSKRYGGQGANYFEIWNEPNNPDFWAPKPDPAAYTADLKAAYAAIKAVDSSAIVLSGALAPELDSSTSYAPLTFLEDMYEDGAGGSFDGLGYHPYSYPADPDTDIPQSAWSQMSQTSPSIRSIMAAHGDSAKKIWITEFGAPTSGASTNVSDADQSAELVQAISQVENLSWVASFYIYTWEDVAGEGFGLLTADGAQKPAYGAVAAALPR